MQPRIRKMFQQIAIVDKVDKVLWDEPEARQLLFEWAERSAQRMARMQHNPFELPS